MDDRNQCHNDSPNLRRPVPDGTVAEPVRTRWTPKPEQILILESIFNSGMVNPPKGETVRIRKLLEQFGSVGDANVFYWFQNRRSRSRRRQRQLQASLMAGQQVSSGAPRASTPPTSSSASSNTSAGGGAGLFSCSSFASSSSSPNFTIDGGADDLFSICRQMGFMEGTQDISQRHYQPGTVIVFINGVLNEVPSGPIDLRAMFGHSVMLVHSSGEWFPPEATTTCSPLKVAVTRTKVIDAKPVLKRSIRPRFFANHGTGRQCEAAAYFPPQEKQNAAPPLNCKRNQLFFSPPRRRLHRCSATPQTPSGPFAFDLSRPVAAILLDGRVGPVGALSGMAEASRRRPKTKIVCTLGPASRSVEMIERFLMAGMNVARFNFSHGSHAYHQETLDNLRAAMDNTGILCAVMLDTKGPEIRTGFLKDGKPIHLQKGQEITVTTDYSIKGDENMISMSYKKLAEDLKPNSVILCADGTITLTVLACDKESGLVRCRCENSAVLGERKNVNLPGVIVDLPTLTEKDKEDILKWGIPNKIDMIALSFVRKGSDLVEVRKVLGKHAKSIMLMSKVENQEGVANFDDILANSDAFMVARGDLGMEIPIEKIFYAQKVMILKCNMKGKPVVTATQMLESMIKSPRPTRAEATDVANAVLDGTDCVMLSGETAAGAYPELAVQTMAKICLEAESYLDYGAVFKGILATAPVPMSPIESLASSAVRTANSAKASLILVLTRGGSTAKLVAKYRPAMPILSVVVPELKTDSFDWFCSDEAPARHSLVFRGLIPVLSCATAKSSDTESTDEAIEFAIQHAKAGGLCKPGESVVALHRVGVASVIKILTVQ
ncbi:Pyruvate kinase [Musa troglodytarum]|uniref:Pyruvate kinase n=1 Tax=Musa troglodytarum TaxID=320322 RepID=A0A9E7HZ44_9LILI|nr:Pyruvate kinase [Musa troglodytarum]